MKKKELPKLIEKGESETLEFKEGFCSAQELAKEMCAFANSKGGTILLGVDDSGRKTGIKLKENIEEHIITIASNNLNPKIMPEISILDDVVKIDISKGEDKPYSANGIYYLRIGSVSRQMGRDELLDLMQKSGKIQFDSKICEDASLDDIDEEKLRWFLGEARRERGLKIQKDAPIAEVLMRLKLLQDGKLTNATVLLFGKDPQNFFIQHEVKCIRFDGNKPVKPYIDFQTIEGNVFDLVDKAEDFVLRNIRKAIWLDPGRVQREERHEYPPDAIREAIVNAVAHRDYYSPSKVQVRIFDDYIEVWNPGSLPEGWTVETLKQKHESIPKNPLLFKQLFWVRYVEDVGGGTIDMIEKCGEWGIPEPEFEFTGTSLVVTFSKAVLTEELMKKLGLNDRQKKAVGYLKEHKTITNRRYCELCGVVKDTANRDLNDLLGKRLIEKRGSGPKTYYMLKTTVRYRPIPSDTGKAKKGEKKGVYYAL